MKGLQLLFFLIALACFMMAMHKGDHVGAEVFAAATWVMLFVAYGEKE